MGSKINFEEILGVGGYVYGLSVDGFAGIYLSPNSLSCIY